MASTSSASLTSRQLKSIEFTERITSILSLTGALFIIVTFLTSKAFGKSINRLVFYASIGNILSNVGTLISISGIQAGGTLCQFQGFLIQMFLPADALWTLAMACNVYLTFFHKYDAKALRGLEWKYLVICYGLPFIPAFAYFFISTKDRGRVYGDAVLWCWVDVGWDFLRVAAFYGPVWVIILVTFGIYIIAGKEIFEKRKALREFSTTHDSDAPYPMTNTMNWESKITKEVHISSEPAGPPSDGASQSSVKMSGDEESGSLGAGYDPYSVTIEIGNDRPWNNNMRSPSIASPTVVQRTAYPAAAADMSKISRMAANRAAFGYARVSLLFFCAILVTWVPSTVNRVASLVRPDDVNFSLSYVSALVLPLQGFWNSVIYICTSLPACRSYWSDLKASLAQSRDRSGSINTISTQKPIKSSIYTSRSLGRDKLVGETESTRGFVSA